MNRFWGHTLSTAVLTVAVGSAIPACAHDDASLFIHGVLAPPTPAGSLCTYTADPTAATISRGLVDGALTDAYAPEMLLGSTLIPQGNATQPDSETARIEVQGAQVRVVDPVDNSEWMNNTVLTSGIIEPASGTAPSYTAISATLMDAKAVAHFTPPVGQATKLAVVYVSFYGQTLGGQSVESNQFQFPVDVCAGCLVYFPPGAKAQNYCSGAVASTGTAHACVTGQDQSVDCQVCYPLAVCTPQ
jgi:hypothetical protein